MTAIIAILVLAAIVALIVASLRSPFDRRRPGWFLAALLLLWIPLLWPFGIYILVKLYRTRGPRPPVEPVVWSKPSDRP